MSSMKKIRSNEVVRIVSVVFALIFPIMLFAVSWEVTLSNVWIAFYSIVLLWIIQENKVVKVVFSVINFLAVAVITGFFLMGGTDIILGVILKAIIPFWRNPWFT